MSDNGLHSDESLMEQVCCGDHQAFSVLVNAYTPLLFSVAYRMCARREMAENLVQEAFLKLWQKPQSFDPYRGVKFSTWMYRVVTNLSIDRLRKEKRAGYETELDFEIEDTADSVDNILVYTEQQSRLERAIQNLPVRQKAALNLCVYEGFSQKAAAEILGVRLKALESLLMRAKANLRRALKEDLGGISNG